MLHFREDSDLQIYRENKTKVFSFLHCEVRGSTNKKLYLVSSKKKEKKNPYRYLNNIFLICLKVLSKHLNIHGSINTPSVCTLRGHSLAFLSLFLSYVCWPHTRPSIQRPSSSSHSGPLRCLCRHWAAWDWSVRLKEPVRPIASSSLLTGLYRVSFDFYSPLGSKPHEEAMF